MRHKRLFLTHGAPVWLWVVVGLIAWGLIACGVQPSQSEPTSNTTATAVRAADTPTNTADTSAASPTPAPAKASESPAAMNVRQVLAQQLRVDPASIQIVSAEPVTWPDACLGKPDPAELCAAAETPGYRLTLETQEGRYLYHTDASGNRTRLIEAPEPVTGEKIIAWSGISDQGECQRAIIGPEGVAFARCGNAPVGGKFAFDSRPADLAEFAGRYASFQADTPAGSLEFTGYGPTIATPAEQRLLAEWARLVVLEAQFGRSGASWGLVFAWRREGGPADFCDEVTVYVTGDVYISSCRDEQPVDLNRSRLDADQLATVYEWVDSLAPFEHDDTDPATADAMTIHLVFSGTGAQENVEPEWLLISDFAQTLYNEATMQAGIPPDVCPTPEADEQVLFSEEQGYCLLYPAEYSLVQSGPEAVELVIDTVMNHIDPRLSIMVTKAAGRTLDDAAAQLAADYVPPGFNVERQTIMIDGVEAVVFDNLPGQDLNRRVVFIQNERLYSWFLSPLGDEGSETRQQAEALYQQALASFRFLNDTTPTPDPAAIQVLPSDVEYVLALTDLKIYSGPEIGQAVVGDVFGGQMALVTGASADGQWWRVICPDDTVGNCFVSADPALTQPTTPPDGQ